MTVLTVESYFGPDRAQAAASVIRLPSQTERAQAGAQAYARASRLNYSRPLREAFRRAAWHALKPGESARACADRVVPVLPRGTDPEAA